jgi:hypothetical protein
MGNYNWQGEFSHGLEIVIFKLCRANKDLLMYIYLINPVSTAPHPQLDGEYQAMQL